MFLGECYVFHERGLQINRYDLRKFEFLLQPSEEPIDIPWAKKAIHEIGYEMTGSSNEPYEKKGLFHFGKK